MGVATTLPPMAVWRFKEPSPALEIAIQNAVTRFHGKITWELDNKRNTWILYPKRVREITEANELVGLLAGLDMLMAKEPEFGIQANAEFEELTAFLQKALSLTTLPAKVSYNLQKIMSRAWILSHQAVLQTGIGKTYEYLSAGLKTAWQEAKLLLETYLKPSS